MQEIKAIIEEAIPLDPSCEVRRTDELRRRARLRIRLEELLRDRSQPFKPDLEYKNSILEETSGSDVTIK